jgi:hypothetical protein
MENLDLVPLDNYSMIHIEGGNLWGRVIIAAWELAGAIDEFADDFKEGWDSVDCNCEG